jgi:hypothetical protein
LPLNIAHLHLREAEDEQHGQADEAHDGQRDAFAALQQLALHQSDMPTLKETRERTFRFNDLGN